VTCGVSIDNKTGVITPIAPGLVEQFVRSFRVLLANLGMTIALLEQLIHSFLRLVH
jgi:hypothetical protein